MPLLIRHIDEISRDQTRDVLWVTFFKLPLDPFTVKDCSKSARRQTFVAFLEAQQIPWTLCGEVWSAGFIGSYYGSIYLDVPNEPARPQYRALAAYLETPDGKPKLKDVYWWVLPLAVAIDVGKQSDAASMNDW